MNYKKYKYDNYKLHIIKTKKFVKTLVVLKFRTSLSEEKYNKMLLLSQILTYSTKKYNSNQLLNKELLKNYNTNINSETFICGNNIISSFFMSFLDDKLVNDNVSDNSFNILNEVLFNPNIIDKQFDQQAFDISYKEIENSIKELKEQQEDYARSLLYKKMNKNAPYAINIEGNLKILKEINSKNLYGFYKEFIKGCNIDIYIVGNVEDDNIIEKISSIFKNNKSKYIDYSCYYDLKINNKVKKVIKKKETNQAKLLIGFDIEKLNIFEKVYVLSVYNYLLGGSAISRLFKNVREKNSLAYYVNSRSKTFDNILIISTGIDKRNYEKTVDLIMKNMDDLKQNIEDEEFNLAIENKISRYNKILDTAFGIVEMYYSSILDETNDIDEYITNIKKVTKKDVINIANKIKLNTIYLYGGDQVGKN